MSTVIHNLYKYEYNDIWVCLQELKRVRRKHIEKTLEYFREIYDDIGGEKVKQNMEYYTKIHENDPYNIESSICVYFHETDLYLHLFGVDKNLFSHTLYDFWYDDRSDVSEEEVERLDVLYDIFGENMMNIPSHIGFVFPILDNSDIWRIMLCLRTGCEWRKEW